MGKTVPSYRIALELEIATWKAFGKALNSEGQEAFSELMDICRGFATASGNACNPVLFEQGDLRFDGAAKVTLETGATGRRIMGREISNKNQRFFTLRT